MLQKLSFYFKHNKWATTLLTLSIVLAVNVLPLFVGHAFSACTNAGDCLNQSTTSGSIFGGGNTSLPAIIQVIIKLILSVLAVIFVLLIIYAGFIWMIARGEEDEIKKALDTIRGAIFGLIILLAAYAITEFVFNKLGATTLGGV